MDNSNLNFLYDNKELFDIQIGLKDYYDQLNSLLNKINIRINNVIHITDYSIQDLLLIRNLLIYKIKIKNELYNINYDEKFCNKYKFLLDIYYPNYRYEINSYIGNTKLINNTITLLSNVPIEY